MSHPLACIPRSESGTGKWGWENQGAVSAPLDHVVVAPVREQKQKQNKKPMCSVCPCLVRFCSFQHPQTHIHYKQLHEEFNNSSFCTSLFGYFYYQVLSTWHTWVPCSVTRGLGQHHRTRDCLATENNNEIVDAKHCTRMYAGQSSFEQRVCGETWIHVLVCKLQLTPSLKLVPLLCWYIYIYIMIIVHQWMNYYVQVTEPLEGGRLLQSCCNQLVTSKKVPYRESQY